MFDWRVRNGLPKISIKLVLNASNSSCQVEECPIQVLQDSGRIQYQLQTSVDWYPASKQPGRAVLPSELLDAEQIQRSGFFPGKYYF
jgi:hypothetical protein